jgi:hypothetical protein
MSDNPEFYMHEFEDYLFKAIQHARSLTYDDLMDSQDVERYLSLAHSQVSLFVARVQNKKSIDEGNKV